MNSSNSHNLLPDVELQMIQPQMIRSSVQNNDSQQLPYYFHPQEPEKQNKNEEQKGDTTWACEDLDCEGDCCADIISWIWRLPHHDFFQRNSCCSCCHNSTDYQNSADANCCLFDWLHNHKCDCNCCECNNCDCNCDCNCNCDLNL